MLITEHVLQLSYDGKEMTSLNGRTFKVISDKTLRSTDDPSFQAMIISRDITYADQQRTFKRMLINNCLDPRHFSPDANLSEESKVSDDQKEDAY